MASETPANEATSPDSPEQPVTSNRGERVAKLGTIVSAIVASSCCWGPPLLIGLGLLFGFSADRTIGWLQAAMETYRPIFMVVTFGFLALAFFYTYRPRRAVAAGCPAPC